MNARDVALSVVRDVFPTPPAQGAERGAQASLDYRARAAKLDARDRAFATELAYGAIKMRRTLDWYLDPFLGDRAKTIPPAVREILRLAFYELIYTRADEHATVFEFVNLAKRYGHRGLANLANAVLRGFLRDRPHEPVREDFESDDEYLGVRYSLPTWLVRQWRSTFGAQVEAICAGVNEPARSALVFNQARASREEFIERWAERGIALQPSAFVEESLLVDRASALAGENGADELWWPQSESSAMPVAILSPQPGESELDVCSGRGNKALQIAMRMEGDGTLLCLERDARKAAVLGERFERAGFVAGTVIGDATADVLGGGQRFDRILVDAPCSGVGVVGRHPEARWKKQSTDGERLGVTQRAILDRMATHVHPGGSLLYAVCSTDPRETTEVIDEFLKRAPFERGLVPVAFESLLTEDGDVVVAPGIEGRDGFYIARLERRT